MIPLAATESITVRRIPLLFESPVSFRLVEEQPEAPEAIDHDDALDDDESPEAEENEA